MIVAVECFSQNELLQKIMVREGGHGFDVVFGKRKGAVIDDVYER